MRPDVEHDFEWGRQFIPELKQIIGVHLIGEAPFEDDAKRATDLIVLRLEAIRIACRIRRHQYLEPYGDEFTIRTDRPSGAETELGKLISGWGDYIIYGFASDDDSPPLVAWVLADLSVFRLWYMRELVRLKGVTPGAHKANFDGTRFAAFPINSLPAEFVVGRLTPFARAA
jgi:hypothetical protein